MRGDEEEAELLDLRYMIAGDRVVRAALRLSMLLGKANFNPNQPRVPQGDPHGGRWTQIGAGTGTWRAKPGIIRVSDDGDLPNIPPERPPIAKERFAVARRVAAWLARNGIRTGIRLSPIGRLLDVAAWVYELEPFIDAFPDPAKTLEELQRDLGQGRRGYETHHIVEEDAARKAGFAESRIQARENKVLIPTFPHWWITSWYMRRNEKFGMMSPREYLRDKSWEERRKVGLETLIEHGVLKP